MKIWGRLNSINVQKVILALEEIGLTYERVDAGAAFGVNDTPDYLAMNPTGLVPTMDDDGFVLWESNAIVRYLCASRAPGRFWREDVKVRAEADRWMDWMMSLSAAMAPGFMQLVRTPADKRNPATVEESVAKTKRLVAMLEAHLAKNDYIAGADYGIGDFVVAPIMHRWLNMPVERGALPGVEAWHARVMRRPAAQRVLTLPIT